MKTKLSVSLKEIYQKYHEFAPNDSQWNDLLEAKDTLENQAEVIRRYEERITAGNMHYKNLYESRQQMIKDFRTGIVLSILITATLITISYYFL
jgi:hypothetical protein